jgi:DNA-binding winged helix-turn-helix (wHTH) protein/Tol biopolymer transport system component
MTISRSPQPDRVFRFGSFELSEREGELRKNGVRIKLQEHPFRVLLELLSNAGRLVTREELQQKLWPEDTFVDFDVGVNTAIRKLRQALGDEADNPRFIETLSRRGYRFVAPIVDVVAAPQPTGQDLPSETPDSLPSDGTGTSPDTGGDSRLAAVPRNRRWYLVLAASCALALVIYGTVLTSRRMSTTPTLATEQPITANPSEAPITGAVVSPDGKYVAYSDTTGVYIRHMDSGETRPLLLPKGFEAVPTSWFPDGTHLLVSSGETLYWFGRLNPGVIPGLWKVSLLGGSPQKLVDNATGGVVAPDGSKIAYVRGDDVFSREVWVMGNDGDNPHKVVGASGDSVTVGDGTTNQQYSGSFFSGLAWSPDGMRLAYLRIFAAASSGSLQDKYFLETVAVSGGAPKVLKISTQLLPIVCWSADERLMYGYRDDLSSERMNYGVWWVRVNQRSGESEGKEVQLTKGTGRLGGLSVTADGRRMVLWRDNLSPAVFLTELDSQTRRFTRPRRLTFDESPNMVTDWTPDSRAVLVVSNRSGTYKLYRQSIDQAVPEVLVEGRGVVLPRVSPDGTQVLYLDGYNPESPAQPINVMAVPLAGGQPRVVLRMSNITAIECTRSPSKLCLIATTDRLSWFDPNTGKVEPFLPAQGTAFDNWSISPDGSLIALFYHGSMHKLSFVTVSDKTRREVELKESVGIGMDWAADGKTIFVTGLAENGAPVVVGVEPDGNHRVLLEGDKSTAYWWLIPSPDGRYAALEEVTGANNVWMVENF